MIIFICICVFLVQCADGFQIIGRRIAGIASISRASKVPIVIRIKKYVKGCVSSHLTALSFDDDIEGGPQISKSKRDVISKFVEKLGGKRVIQRILIANNGMAATKSILSMRQWAYITLGDERAIEFVAMATRDDLNANAEFIRLADTFVEVPSGSNKVQEIFQFRLFLTFNI